MKFRKTSITILLLTICYNISFAQRDPSLISSRNYVGIEFGVNDSWLWGSQNFFFPVNDSYIDPGFSYVMPLGFTKLGSGFGIALAATLDLSLSDFWGIQGKIFYHTNNIGSTEQFTENCPSTTETGVGTALIENNYKLHLSSAGGHIGARLQFIPESFYGTLGFDYSANTSAHLSGYQKIVSSSAGCQYLYYPSGRSTGSSEIPVPDQDVSSWLNASQFALDFGIGTFIPFGHNGVVLTPELNFSIPLSRFFSADRENIYKNGYPLGDPKASFAQTAMTPKLWSATLSIALKFPFGAKRKEDIISSPPVASSGQAPHEQQYAHLKGKVTDATTGDPLRSKVTVVDLGTDSVVSESSTNTNGEYDVNVKAPGKYSVTADADDHLFGSTYFAIDSSGRILKGDGNIKLDNAKNGRTRLLIFFDFNKDNLQPDSYPELDRAVTIMKTHPSMQVEIAGYTDSVGTDEYNLALSLRRANTVRDYLVSNGIDGAKITAKGYGKVTPITPNNSDEGRAENRRVEFIVVRQ